jgi:hypothetical protein
MVPSAHCHPSQSPLQVSALPITKILAKKLFAMTRNTFSKTLGPRLRCSHSRMIQDGDSFVARSRIESATVSRKRNGEWRMQKLAPPSTSLSDGDKWSASSPHNFTPGRGNHLHLLDTRVGRQQNLSACGGEDLYPAEMQNTIVRLPFPA